MIGKNMHDVNAAGNYPRPKAGGYVIRIKNVVNNKTNERLDIDYDFYEGEFKGYYEDLHARAGFWAGRFTKSYKDTALPFFRAFIEAVTKSNPDTDGLVVGDYEDVDETKLPGKLVGMVAGEREYTGNDGQRKRNLDNYNATFVTVDDIHSGNFTVPELRVADDITPAQAPAAVDMSTDGFIPDANNPPF